VAAGSYASVPTSEARNLLSGGKPSDDDEAEGAEGGGGAQFGRAREAALEAEHAAEARVPWQQGFELLRAWAVVFLLALLKGGHGAPSLLGVSCGSLGYWATVSLNFPVLALLTVFAARSRLGTHERRLSMGYEYVEGDVQWDLDKVNWPLHNIAITNIVWCIAYTRGVGGGAYLAQ